MKELTLVHIGRDSCNRPVYQSEGRLFVDVEPRKGKKPKIFTKLENAFDGEPDTPISYDYVVKFIPNRDTWD